MMGTARAREYKRGKNELIPETVSGLTAYFRFYDEDRPHQSLDYRTPGEVYRAGVRGRLRGGGP